MGASDPVRVFKVFRGRRELPRLSPEAGSIKPRDYREWKALREWGQLPYWEIDPPGYLLRLAREETGITQRELATRLGITQQAVAQAERWDSNPTVASLRRWAEACGHGLEVVVRGRAGPPDR